MINVWNQESALAGLGLGIGIDIG